MTRWLRSFVALPEDQSAVPSTHIKQLTAIYKLLQTQLKGLQHPFLTSMHIATQKYTHVHKQIIIKAKKLTLQQTYLYRDAGCVFGYLR